MDLKANLQPITSRQFRDANVVLDRIPILKDAPMGRKYCQPGDSFPFDNFVPDQFVAGNVVDMSQLKSANCKCILSTSSGVPQMFFEGRQPVIQNYDELKALAKSQSADVITSNDMPIMVQTPFVKLDESSPKTAELKNPQPLSSLINRIEVKQTPEHPLFAALDVSTNEFLICTPRATAAWLGREDVGSLGGYASQLDQEFNRQTGTR